LSSYLWPRFPVLDFGDATASNFLERARQFVGLVKLFYIITAPDALSYQQDIWYGSSAGHMV
jgi:hypothetical protein